MAEMLAKAREIAAALGDGWTARKGVWEDGRDAYLDGNAGEELHVRTGTRFQNRDRIEITCSLESEYLSSSEEPRREITVSKDRPPKQVAGDITRRMLPEYLPALVLCRQRKAQAEEKEAARWRLQETIAGILPAGGHLRHAPDRVSSKHGTTRTEARVVSANRVDWQVQTGTERDSLALAELLAALASGRAHDRT